jgi:hypothetical protein
VVITNVATGVTTKVGDLGAQQVFDLTLRVGSASTEVMVVTAEAPAVQRNSSDISAVGERHHRPSRLNTSVVIHGAGSEQGRFVQFEA